MSALPLEGIRVLDLGISTAGPYSARFLGDLGAEVIKIEPLDGENARSLGLRFGDVGYLFHVNNYNKKSITLKVQHPRGRAVFLDLVARSDVVIENFALGTMAGWGVGFADCERANPGIIYCSAKGYGDNGPWRSKRAFDTVVQGMSGIMDATGRAADPPVKGGPSICDLMTAAVSAMAVTAALHARVQGRSQFIDTALFDMGVWSMLEWWPLTAHRLDSGHPLHTPFGRIAAGPGEIMLTVTNDREWGALAALLGLPVKWSCDERRANEPVITAALAREFAASDPMSAAARLQAIGVPAAPVCDLEQVAHSPQLRARDLVTPIEHPVFGPVPLIRSPLALGDDARPGVHRAQPTLGEHTDEIIGGLLGRAAELASLRAEGVIA